MQTSDAGDHRKEEISFINGVTTFDFTMTWVGCFTCKILVYLVEPLTIMA